MPVIGGHKTDICQAPGPCPQCPDQCPGQCHRRSRSLPGPPPPDPGGPGPRRGLRPGPCRRSPPGPPASAGAAVAHQAGKYPDFTHTPAGPSQSESSSSCQWPGGLQESKSSVTGPGPVAMIGAITQKLRRLCRNYAEIKQIMHKLRRNYGLPVGITDWADWDLQGLARGTGTAPLSHGQ